MIAIDLNECYKITETSNRPPLQLCARKAAHVVNTIPLSAHAVNIIQVVSLLSLSKLKDDWILFYLHGTAVILGKKATQNMYADVSVHKLHRVEL